MKVMRSRSCSLRFFSRCTWMMSEPGMLQRRDRGVEVAMLLLQARELRPKIVFFLLRHCRLGGAWARSWAASLSAGKWLWIIAFR